MVSNYDYCFYNCMGFIPVRAGRQRGMMSAQNTGAILNRASSIGMSCYKTSYRKGRSNLSAVFCVGIKAENLWNTKQVIINSLSAIEKAVGQGNFVMPTYVQYDTTNATPKHTARMIWQFDQPYKLSTLKSQRRDKNVKMLNDLSAHLASTVSALTGYTFKPMRITDQLPLNGRWGSNGMATDLGWRTTERFQVRTDKLSDDVSFDVLHDSSLTIGKTILGWETVDALSALSYPEIGRIENYLARRRAFLVRYSADCSDRRRYSLLKDYANVCITLGYSAKRAEIELQIINKQFPHPLDEETVESRMVYAPYKIRDETFYGRYGMPSMVTSKAAARREEFKHRKRWQRPLTERDEKMADMALNGISGRKIREIMHTSLAHLKRVVEIVKKRIAEETLGKSREEKEEMLDAYAPISDEEYSHSLFALIPPEPYWGNGIWVPDTGPESVSETMCTT